MQVGDSVIVEKGQDSQSSRQKNASSVWSINTLANEKWYVSLPSCDLTLQ